MKHSIIALTLGGLLAFGVSSCSVVNLEFEEPGDMTYRGESVYTSWRAQFNDITDIFALVHSFDVSGQASNDSLLEAGFYIDNFRMTKLKDGFFACYLGNTNILHAIIETDGLNLKTPGNRWKVVYPLAEGDEVQTKSSYQVNIVNELANHSILSVSCLDSAKWQVDSDFGDTVKSYISIVYEMSQEEVLPGILFNKSWKVSGKGCLLVYDHDYDLNRYDPYAFINFDISEAIEGNTLPTWTKGKIDMTAEPFDSSRSADAFQIGVELQPDDWHAITYKGITTTYHKSYQSRLLIE